VVTSGVAEAARDLRESEEVNDENSSCDNALETPPRCGSGENARAGWVIVCIDCSGEKGRRQRAEGGRGKEINVRTVCRRPQLGRSPHPSDAFSFPPGTCIGTKDPLRHKVPKMRKDRRKERRGADGAKKEEEKTRTQLFAALMRTMHRWLCPDYMRGSFGYPNELLIQPTRANIIESFFPLSLLLNIFCRSS
jgi:hypothetical protein